MSDLAASVLRKSQETTRTIERFFTQEAERIVACARAMAARFDEGAKLYAFGNGGSSCDAAHVAVEFVHPIFERRPAIPAMSLANDSALLTAVSNDAAFSLAYAKSLRLLARAGDVALGISTSGKSASVNRALEAARDLRLLTVGVCGGDGGAMVDLCEHTFIVPSYSIHRIQETHVALLHILWDMVHVVRGEEDIVG